MSRFLPLWLDEQPLQQLFATAAARGGQMRAVGGCVRDHLMGRKSYDIDLATTLHPKATMQLGDALGFKAIPTGFAHGTVTLVLPNRTVEITTLRCDVATDGRHAEVAFTTHFEEDAARRDFTMNALYMDAQGAITDFVGGRADIEVGRVRFIGDAAQRIREDGLRILRFFRFLATHGQPPVDEEALRAIGALRFMLEPISGERIQQEMKKLLSAPDPSYALARMAVLALGEALCGQPWNVAMLQPLLQHEAQQRYAPDPWLRLLAMVAPAQRIAAAQHITQRWKLSRADTQYLEFVTAPPTLDTPRAVREALRHYKREWIMPALMLLAVDEQVDLHAVMPIARSFEPPVFPITARDLLARGMVEGKELGDTLRTLERRWIDSDYRLSKEALLP